MSFEITFNEGHRPWLAEPNGRGGGETHFIGCMSRGLRRQTEMCWKDGMGRSQFKSWTSLAPQGYAGRPNPPSTALFMAMITSWKLLLILELVTSLLISCALAHSITQALLCFPGSEILSFCYATLMCYLVLTGCLFNVLTRNLLSLSKMVRMWHALRSRAEF